MLSAAIAALTAVNRGQLFGTIQTQEAEDLLHPFIGESIEVPLANPAHFNEFQLAEPSQMAADVGLLANARPQLANTKLTGHQPNEKTQSGFHGKSGEESPGFSEFFFFVSHFPHQVVSSRMTRRSYYSVLMDVKKSF